MGAYLTPGSFRLERGVSRMVLRRPLQRYSRAAILAEPAFGAGPGEKRT